MHHHSSHVNRTSSASAFKLWDGATQQTTRHSCPMFYLFMLWVTSVGTHFSALQWLTPKAAGTWWIISNGLPLFLFPSLFFFAYTHSLILLLPFLILFFQFVSILTYLTAMDSSKPSFSYSTPVFVKTAFLTHILTLYSLITFDAYTYLWAVTAIKVIDISINIFSMCSPVLSFYTCLAPTPVISQAITEPLAVTMLVCIF